MQQTGGEKAPSQPFMTFCHQELLHAQWKIILDDDFMAAWEHGIVIMCCDGIQRRFYLHIFAHSGDYPEKYAHRFRPFFFVFIHGCRILLASIRNLGMCPCPCCLVPLSCVHNLGMPRDTSQRTTMARIDDDSRRSKVFAARTLIYEKQYNVDSAAVEKLLKEKSWVPTAVSFNKVMTFLMVTHQAPRMLSLKDYPGLASTFSTCSWSI
jgi:hypothetical protein